MTDRPAHLGPKYGAQFEDESIAQTYATRPPYPAALFELLLGLIPEGSSAVLDLGCGTGAIAHGLASQVKRVDAVDPSAAMLQVARERVGTAPDRITWTEAAAEQFAFKGPYGLVVAAESIHWMEWGIVLPRILGALRLDGTLALVSGRSFRPLPWEAELLALIPSYSTNQDYQPYDIIEELTSRGLFREAGRETTHPEPFAQSLDDYVESFHTRNGFSRERMTPEAAGEFDAAVRALVRAHVSDDMVRGEIQGTVVWGHPVGREVPSRTGGPPPLLPNDSRGGDTSFDLLSYGWNACPASPVPTVRAVGADLLLTFRPNVHIYPGLEDVAYIQLTFVAATHYRLGGTNDEGWYMNQCRFKRRAPKWGQFYEVGGNLHLKGTEGSWICLGDARAHAGRHFLFYFRDETFECDATDWRMKTIPRR